MGFVFWETWLICQLGELLQCSSLYSAEKTASERAFKVHFPRRMKVGAIDPDHQNELTVKVSPRTSMPEQILHWGIRPFLTSDYFQELFLGSHSQSTLMAAQCKYDLNKIHHYLLQEVKKRETNPSTTPKSPWTKRVFPPPLLPIRENRKGVRSGCLWFIT